MQELDLSGLDELIDRFGGIAKKIPQMRRDMHEALAERLKEAVDTEIAVSINDSHGKIRSWQYKAVGKNGGYSAIRAINEPTGPNSPGAITNYLENGHMTRGRAYGRSKSKRPKVKVNDVPGAHFYALVRGRIVSEVMSAAEDFLSKVAKEIKG